MRRLSVPILMYHHVVGAERSGGQPPRHPESYLPLAQFRRHLDLLRRGGFHTLTLARALALHLEAVRLPRRGVVLSFDDGCSCFLRLALPELKARRMTATLFVVSGELGGCNRWDLAEGEKEERLLSAAELREVAAAGIEIACHSHSHPDLTTCNDRRLDEEVRASRRVLEEAMRASVQTFCYPYGSLDHRVQQAVQGAAYRGAVAIHGKPHASFDDLFALPRMVIRPDDSLFEFWLKVRGLYAGWSRLPRLGILTGLRRRRDFG